MFATNLRENSKGKKKCLRLLTILLLTAVAVFFTMGETALAKRKKKNSEELDEAKVFIEWNSTDTDYGIQFFWDSLGFTRMMVFNHRGKKVLDVNTKKNLKAQGLTEAALESVEPPADEVSMEEFFARFPEGDYEFWGKSIEGGWLFGEAEFTHDLVTPVDIILGSWPTISWEPGEAVAAAEENGDEVEAVRYEIVVELVVLVVDEDGEEDEQVYKNTATFPGDADEYTVPQEFLDLIAAAGDDVDELKVEIVADEESGNRTITELGVCFEEDDNACPDD